MLTDKLIHVEIVGKKAKVHSGGDGVEEYFLKQMLPWLPQVDDFALGDESTLAFVSLDKEFGFFFFSSLNNSMSVGDSDRTVTRIMPVTPESLLCCYSNPALMAFSCFSSGLFSGVGGTLGVLPDNSLFEPQRWAAEYRLAELTEIARAIEVHDRGVLILEDKPLKYLAGVYSRIPENRRWETSFAVGSRITNMRPFHLQIRPELDRKTQEFLIENQIRYFELNSSTRVSSTY